VGPSGKRKQRVVKPDPGRDRLLKGLIETLDNIDRAMEHAKKDMDLREVNNMVEGLESIRRSTLLSLKREGVTCLDPTGGDFDPHYHEAVGTISIPGKRDGSVGRVELKGYMRGDVLLRPAKVVVCKNTSGEERPSGISLGIPGYVPVAKLGQGGSSSVFLTRHDTGREVALKIPKIQGEGSDEKKALRRFLEEAKNWKRLAGRPELSPGVVDIYTYSLEPKPHIIMEYMKGGNLKQNMPLMTVDSKLECLGSILGTLYEVHNLGMIHRDIKPQNILTDGKGRWKLADWGLSKVLLEGSKGLSNAGTITATIKYASPEQLEPEEYGGVDRRTDIYQCGVLAYELISGKKPFEGKPAQVVFSILTKNPLPLSDLNEGIEGKVSEAIMRAMKKNKEDRFQDAGEFRRALLGDNEKNRLKVYFEALEESMRDGRFSLDEVRMLKRLRRSLSITEEEHRELMGELVDPEEEDWD